MIRLLLFVVVVVAMEECPSDFPYTTAYEPSKCQTTLIRAGGTSDFEWGYTAENGKTSLHFAFQSNPSSLIYLLSFKLATVLLLLWSKKTHKYSTNSGLLLLFNQIWQL